MPQNFYYCGSCWLSYIIKKGHVRSYINIFDHVYESDILDYADKCFPMANTLAYINYAKKTLLRWVRLFK
jgi:hypothetical protein